MQMDDIPLFERLRLKFTIDNKAAQYCEFSNDTQSCISPLGSFQSGMIFDIRDELLKLDPTANIEYDQNVLNTVCPLKENNGKFEMPTINGITPYDYQIEDVKLAMQFGRGIIESPTATGKSLIIYSICYNLLKTQNYPILILVPNLHLVHQMHSDFIDYGMLEDEISMFSSFSKSIDWKKTKIVVSNSQWLDEHGDELPQINAVIIDECHICKSENKVTDFVRKLPTYIRFGFTGTLPEDIKDIWAVKGIIGPLLSTSRAYQYQEAGTLAAMKIIAIRFEQHRPQPYAENPNKKFYEEWKMIEKCKKSNDIIVELAMKSKGNTIILFDHTVHGQELFSICNMQALDTNKDVRFINGAVNMDIRIPICENIESSDNVVLVANVKCFGVGVNIKNVDTIILAISGKGQTKIIQAIGRGLRLLAGKTFLSLFDIHHSWKYSTDHFLQRMQLYKEHYDKSKVDIAKTIVCPR